MYGDGELEVVVGTSSGAIHVLKGATGHPVKPFPFYTQARRRKMKRVESRLESAWFQRLKRLVPALESKYDELLSSFAPICNLRRYTQGRVMAPVLLTRLHANNPALTLIAISFDGKAVHVVPRFIALGFSALRETLAAYVE